MKTIKSDIELFAAAITEARVDIYVGNSREISGKIARFSPESICVKDAEKAGESAYFWRGKCAVVVTEK